VRIVLSLALSRSWPVHQLDVKNAFLHGTLTETVYYSQPAGFVDFSRQDLVCRVNKSLYEAGSSSMVLSVCLFLSDTGVC
jgi:histone deacetylase 1/2